MTDQSDLSDQTIIRQKEDPYKVTSELLDDGHTELTCSFFIMGLISMSSVTKVQGLDATPLLIAETPGMRIESFPF